MTYSSVYWITGFAGAGKTTVGTALYQKLKLSIPATVMLDGDIMREVFGNDLGYSVEDRLKCAMRYAGLCKMLSEQGITVICCTISMFDSVRSWNRANIPGYVEVYIKASAETLNQRDKKGLYSSDKDDISSDIKGIDPRFEVPKNPDIIIENNGKLTPGVCADIILRGGATNETSETADY